MGFNVAENGGALLDIPANINIVLISLFWCQATFEIAKKSKKLKKSIELAANTRPIVVAWHLKYKRGIDG